MKKPVLFLIFNRPENSMQVFNVIKEYRPIKFYIAADGPRIGKLGEKEICEKTREIIKLIDWECEVKTLFREENLGCKIAISSAIDWFFENETEGIILEDDVVPNKDFFSFCEYSLEKYYSDERVMMITGTNYLSDESNPCTYFFSRHYTIWGWATWRRSWKLYDVNMSDWDNQEVKNDIKYLHNGNFIWKHFRFTFESLRSTYINTWDIQWVFTCLINNGLCVTPRVNLVSNIGVDGTHGKTITDSHFLQTYSLDLSSEVISPNRFIPYSKYDETLHLLKNKKSNRRHSIIKILKKIHLFNTFKYLYNQIK